MWDSVKGSAVDFATVSNLHECDHVSGIVDHIDDAVVSLTDPILIMPGKLFAAWWARIMRQILQTFRYTAKILFWKSTQFAFGRFLNDEVIRVRHV